MTLSSAINADANYIMNKTLISVVGPTAIGKTALAIELAKHLNTEIISADSRQFYKEMRIGTAVPSTEELAAAKHHFIQNISINDPYSVGDFESEAITTLEKLFKTYDTAIMVGGSGLYVNAITKGLDKFPDIAPSIREELNMTLKNKGIVYLQEQLQQLDPHSYNTIALKNPHRLIRALEVCIGTGKPYSSFLNISEKKRNFKTITVGIDAERSIIYDRINQRVDIMVENGLIEEAKMLYPYRDLNALNTVGYKELFQHFDGDITLDVAISEIKKNTRRFAKRQLTWFKKDTSIIWFDYNTSTKKILETLNQLPL